MIKYIFLILFLSIIPLADDAYGILDYLYDDVINPMNITGGTYSDNSTGINLNGNANFTVFEINATSTQPILLTIESPTWFTGFVTNATYNLFDYYKAGTCSRLGIVLGDDGYNYHFQSNVTTTYTSLGSQYTVTYSVTVTFALNNVEVGRTTFSESVVQNTTDYVESNYINVIKPNIITDINDNSNTYKNVCYAGVNFAREFFINDSAIFGSKNFDIITSFNASQRHYILTALPANSNAFIHGEIYNNTVPILNNTLVNNTQIVGNFSGHINLSWVNDLTYSGISYFPLNITNDISYYKIKRESQAAITYYNVYALTFNNTFITRGTSYEYSISVVNRNNIQSLYSSNITVSTYAIPVITINNTNYPSVFQGNNSFYGNYIFQGNNVLDYEFISVIGGNNPYISSNNTGIYINGSTNAVSSTKLSIINQSEVLYTAITGGNDVTFYPNMPAQFLPKNHRNNACDGAFFVNATNGIIIKYIKNEVVGNTYHNSDFNNYEFRGYYDVIFNNTVLFTKIEELTLLGPKNQPPPYTNNLSFITDGVCTTDTTSKSYANLTIFNADVDFDVKVLTQPTLNTFIFIEHISANQTFIRAEEYIDQVIPVEINATAQPSFVRLTWSNTIYSGISYTHTLNDTANYTIIRTSNDNSIANQSFTGHKGNIYDDSANLQRDIQYSYCVKVINIEGIESECSNIINITISTPSIPVISGVHLGQSIELTWSSSTIGLQITGFELLRDDGTSLILSSNVFNYTDSNIIQYATHTYKIRSNSQLGYSNYSLVINVEYPQNITFAFNLKWELDTLYFVANILNPQSTTYNNYQITYSDHIIIDDIDIPAQTMITAKKKLGSVFNTTNGELYNVILDQKGLYTGFIPNDMDWSITESRNVIISSDNSVKYCGCGQIGTYNEYILSNDRFDLSDDFKIIIEAYPSSYASHIGLMKEAQSVPDRYVGSVLDFYALYQNAVYRQISFGGLHVSSSQTYTYPSNQLHEQIIYNFVNNGTHSLIDVHYGNNFVTNYTILDNEIYRVLVNPSRYGSNVNNNYLVTYEKYADFQISKGSNILFNQEININLGTNPAYDIELVSGRTYYTFRTPINDTESNSRVEKTEIAIKLPSDVICITATLTGNATNITSYDGLAKLNVSSADYKTYIECYDVNDGNKTVYSKTIKNNISIDLVDDIFQGTFGDVFGVNILLFGFILLGAVWTPSNIKVGMLVMSFAIGIGMFLGIVPLDATYFGVIIAIVAIGLFTGHRISS